MTHIGSDARLVEGFEHRPGRHCGSTALGNLLRFHRLDLPEAVVFGLAAGPSFFYAKLPGGSPSRLISGRAANLEKQFVELSDDVLEMRSDSDPEGAWRMAREVIDAGSPALLLTDLYYLEHYDNSAHFPGHAIVLAGYDSERAYIADTDFDGLVSISLGSLSNARHSQAPPFPLTGEMVTVPDESKLAQFHEKSPEHIDKAIAFAAKTMVEPPFGDYQGIPALGKLADELPSWPKDAEDWQWCTRFAYQVIERRGTGGGSFRKMYAEFLDHAAEICAEKRYSEAARICAGLAADWTELSVKLRQASKGEASGEIWGELGQLAGSIRDGEERLWRGLLG